MPVTQSLNFVPKDVGVLGVGTIAMITTSSASIASGATFTANGTGNYILATEGSIIPNGQVWRNIGLSTINATTGLCQRVS